MPTPGEFRANHSGVEQSCQLEVPSTGVSQRICLNCGTLLPPGSTSRRRYCDVPCRFEITTNLRNAIRHITRHLSPRIYSQFSIPPKSSASIPAALLLESLPTGKSAVQKMILDELSALDDVMMTEGAMLRATRDMVRIRVGAIVTILGQLTSRDLLDDWMLVAAREFLFDVGMERPFTARKAAALVTHIEAIVDFYNNQKRTAPNLVNLGRAVMKWGEILRILDDERGAAARYNWAYHLLEEGPARRSASDPFAAYYFHQAITWKLRLRAEDFTEHEQAEAIKRLEELAKQVDDPSLWVLHHRNAAYHARVLLDDHELSESHVRQMVRYRNLLPAQHQSVDITLLRPRVDLMVARDLDEAVHFIRNEYVLFYAEHPNKSHFDLLKDWAINYGFDFKLRLPKPAFHTPGLPLVPMRLIAPFV
jgi:hypothetical protein